VKTGTQSGQPELHQHHNQQNRTAARHKHPNLTTYLPKKQTRPTATKAEALRATIENSKATIKTSQNHKLAINIPPGSKFQVLPRTPKTAMCQNSRTNIPINLHKK
jgi:hypothetical protein